MCKIFTKLLQINNNKKGLIMENSPQKKTGSSRQTISYIKAYEWLCYCIKNSKLRKERKERKNFKEINKQVVRKIEIYLKMILFQKERDQ